MKDLPEEITSVETYREPERGVISHDFKAKYLAFKARENYLDKFCPVEETATKILYSGIEKAVGEKRNNPSDKRSKSNEHEVPFAGAIATAIDISAKKYGLDLDFSGLDLPFLNGKQTAVVSFGHLYARRIDIGIYRDDVLQYVLEHRLFINNLDQNALTQADSVFGRTVAMREQGHKVANILAVEVNQEYLNNSGEILRETTLTKRRIKQLIYSMILDPAKSKMAADNSLLILFSRDTEGRVNKVELSSVGFERKSEDRDHTGRTDADYMDDYERISNVDVFVANILMSIVHHPIVNDEHLVPAKEKKVISPRKSDDPTAPYGFKADGTPRGKPGRKAIIK